MDNTIQGQGYIDQLARSRTRGLSTPTFGRDAVDLPVPTTNTGTLEATGGGHRGGRSRSTTPTTVTNTGHHLGRQHLEPRFQRRNHRGGNLTAASAAVIHGISGTTLNGVTITSGTTYSVDAGNNNYLTGDLTNHGTIKVGAAAAAPTSEPDPRPSGTINLSGGGTINLNNANSYLRGYNGNETLINVDNTIQGQGYIDQLGSFQNQGTVDANVSGGTLSIYPVPTTNTGTLEAPAAARSTLSLDRAHTTLTNFAARTLTGGTYARSTSGTLSFNNSGLFQRHRHQCRRRFWSDGTAGTPNFIDQNGNNALAQFATIDARRQLPIQNGMSVNHSLE